MAWIQIRQQGPGNMISICNFLHSTENTLSDLKMKNTNYSRVSPKIDRSSEKIICFIYKNGPSIEGLILERKAFSLEKSVRDHLSACKHQLLVGIFRPC